MTEEGKPLHEWWREEYRARRYLEYLDTAAVHQRYKDITDNIFVLTDECELGFHRGAALRFWARLLTHVQEEMETRPAGWLTTGSFDDLHCPRTNDPLSRRALAALRVGTFGSVQVVKYGQRQFIDEALRSGRMLVSPASFYNDPSLNPAIRDDEQEIVFHADSGDVVLEVDDDDAATSMRRDPVRHVAFTKRARADFYVACFSWQLSARHFGDFDADACLLIRDGIEFVRRLSRAIGTAFPGSKQMGRPVRYVDPCHPGRIADLDVYCAKHFRFMYQTEWRSIWTPANPSHPLKRVFLDLGPLVDIAEVLAV